MLKRRRIELPPELAGRQKLLVRHHNCRVMLVTVGLLGLCFLAVRLLSDHASVAIVLLITAFVLEFYFLLVLLPRADARQCEQIGFICPFCSKPLYYPSSVFWKYSSLITRGQCPHCSKSFIDAASSI